MQNLPSHDELDALVDELFPVLGSKRTGDDFFFDPESLTESTRFYYTDFLKWLGIEQAVLPPERICIHAGREHPANLERQRTGEGYSLYLDNGLYRSLSAVYLALAHQFTHMRLVIDERQSLAEAQKCRPLRLGDDAAADEDDKDSKKEKGTKRKSKKAADEDEPAEVAETGVDDEAADLEVRTEVASFVLGFGKLILNGACAWDELEPRAESVERITTLPTSSLVHVYKKVADHADVGSKSAADGLSEEAQELLGPVKSKKKK